LIQIGLAKKLKTNKTFLESMRVNENPPGDWKRQNRVPGGGRSEKRPVKKQFSRKEKIWGGAEKMGMIKNVVSEVRLIAFSTSA